MEKRMQPANPLRVVVRHIRTVGGHDERQAGSSLGPKPQEPVGQDEMRMHEVVSVPTTKAGHHGHGAKQVGSRLMHSACPQIPAEAGRAMNAHQTVPLHAKETGKARGNQIHFVTTSSQLSCQHRCELASSSANRRELVACHQYTHFN
jgi:hypothetical protein